MSLEHLIKTPYFTSPESMINLIPNCAWIKGTTVFIELYSFKSTKTDYSLVCDAIKRINKSWRVSNWCFDWAAEQDTVLVEPDGVHDFFYVFYKKIINNLITDLHPLSLHLMHGDRDIRQVYDNFHLNNPGHQHIGSVTHVPRFLSHYYRWTHSFKGSTRTIEPKAFTSFNRRKTIYRDRFYRYLQQNNLLDQGYCTFAWDNYNNLSEILPKEYEGDQGYAATEDLISDGYAAANFDVIFETTSIDDNRCFVTEKTVRALAQGQPFVIYNGPGTLNLLQQWGFQTYSTLWDESYDREYNCDVRFQKIADLVRQLMHSDVFNTVEIREINQHNREQFLKLGAKEYRELWLQTMTEFHNYRQGPWTSSDLDFKNKLKQ